MSVITFADKIALKNDPSIARVNKWTDSDANETKNSVNALYNGTVTYAFASLLIPSASILTAFSSPVELVAAPGANKLAVPLQFNGLLDFPSTGGIAYATNTTAQLLRGSVQISAVSNALAATEDALIEMEGISQAVRTPLADHINKGLFFSVGIGNPTDGNSTIQGHLTYMIIDFSSIP